VYKRILIHAKLQIGKGAELTVRSPLRMSAWDCSVEEEQQEEEKQDDDDDDD
jgi:hypothetical protein